jgi:hypothetical protein
MRYINTIRKASKQDNISSKMKFLTGLLGFALGVSAHGGVFNYTIDGKHYAGLV